MARSDLTRQEYLARVKALSADYDQVTSDLLANPEKYGALFPIAVFWHLQTGDVLNKIKKRNFQQALGEMDDIKADAKQNMNRLGQQGGIR